MKKLFKNRMTQEDEKTMRKLRSTYINMNMHKPYTKDTQDGLFFISIQPNSQVDEIKLESDFKFILCLYYRWRYGSKWTKLKYLQQTFQGIIERQQGYHYHLHFILYNLNIEEVAIFSGFMMAMFKQFYILSSFDVQRVYHYDKCKEYIAINNNKKLRTSDVIVITDKMYQ